MTPRPVLLAALLIGIGIGAFIGLIQVAMVTSGSNRG